jgi:hypothetical protein
VNFICGGYNAADYSRRRKGFTRARLSITIEEVKERMDRLKELSAILDFQNYTVPMPNGSVELQMDGGEVGYFSNLLNIKGYFSRTY